MASETRISLSVSDDDPNVAYLTLPNHPGASAANVVAEQKSMNELIEGYKGPDIYLDFDDNGVLIGIEILA